MKSVKCVCCGDEIINTISDHEITYQNANHLSFENGAVGTISYGYGCELDTNAYIIGICRDCTVMGISTGRLVFDHNIDTHPPPIDPEIDKHISAELERRKLIDQLREEPDGEDGFIPGSFY